jgi:deazaflavin-dependent oxidoreductase (nitroreductase family)
MNTAAKTSAITFDDIAALTAEVAAPGGGQGPVANQVNERFIAEFRANKGKIAGELGAAVDLMLLTVTGAKTGKERIIPLAYFEIDGRFVIIASMGGSPRNPTWYVNARANPEVVVEVGAERFKARATETVGADRDALFKSVCERNPVFTTYQEKTARKIPVVELVRI